MSTICHYCFWAEQESELVEVVDWSEIYPVKKHLITFSQDFESSFRDLTKEIIKD